MNNYNPKIHHRKSIRLKGYDYSQAGLYFITICCQNRAFLFGEIENANMILNDAGEIANQFWSDIPNHFPNAVLHEFIVMPNHVHGIIELTDETNDVKAENFLPQQQHHEFQKMIPRSIAAIIKGYKIGVTKWFRQKTAVHDVWQRNYYEHIIRNEKSYQNISNYIINNPAKWAEDKFYTK